MITYTNYAEFMKVLKATHNVTSEDVQREPHGTSYGSRWGVRLGNNVLKNKHTGEVLGYWEVTSADKEPGRGMVTYGRGNVCPSAAQKQKLEDERCYALKIMPEYGQSYISTGTSNSSGPWDKLNALGALEDKRHDLEYDDEFGYGLIQVVKVKKVDGKWVVA
jgi:hypothetical protein